MKVSVVIPTYNEEHTIERTIASVASQASPFDIVVVDGGSTDRTIEVSKSWARVLTAPLGRALQMNHGWRASTGDIVLFLHADTLLPNGALDQVRLVLADANVDSGTFRVQFDMRSPLLDVYSWCTRLKWPLICFGDRGLFVRRRTLEELGGFPEIPLFEDLELARWLYRRGGFCFLKECAITSARRFHANGPVRQVTTNIRLWLRYLLGTDPEVLATEYEYP